MEAGKKIRIKLQEWRGKMKIKPSNAHEGSDSADTSTGTRTGGGFSTTGDNGVGVAFGRPAGAPSARA